MLLVVLRLLNLGDICRLSRKLLIFQLGHWRGRKFHILRKDLRRSRHTEALHDLFLGARLSFKTDGPFKWLSLSSNLPPS